MVKSGLIFGAGMFVVALVITLFLPYCVPCAALFIGFGGGYVAGVFAKPIQQAAGVKVGAIAGLLAGAGAVLGQMLGAVINAVLVGPDKAAQFARSLGLPGSIPMTSTNYWGFTLGINCAMALLSVALMAGLGALGGLVWWQSTGRKQVLVSPAVPPMP